LKEEEAGAPPREGKEKTNEGRISPGTSAEGGGKSSSISKVSGESPFLQFGGGGEEISRLFIEKREEKVL